MRLQFLSIIWLQLFQQHLQSRIMVMHKHRWLLCWLQCDWWILFHNLRFPYLHNIWYLQIFVGLWLWKSWLSQDIYHNSPLPWLWFKHMSYWYWSKDWCKSSSNNRSLYFQSFSKWYSLQNTTYLISKGKIVDEYSSNLNTDEHKVTTQGLFLTIESRTGIILAHDGGTRVYVSLKKSHLFQVPHHFSYFLK